MTAKRACIACLRQATSYQAARIGLTRLSGPHFDAITPISSFQDLANDFAPSS